MIETLIDFVMHHRATIGVAIGVLSGLLYFAQPASNTPTRRRATDAKQRYEDQAAITIIHRGGSPYRPYDHEQDQ